jgi:hypothetical protein
MLPLRGGIAASHDSFVALSRHGCETGEMVRYLPENTPLLCNAQNDIQLCAFR